MSNSVGFLLINVNKSFGDLNKLRDYQKSNPDFETLSLNDFELDGSFNEDFRNVAFMSDTLSDQNCAFNNIWVQINFTAPTSLINISINFGENYPKKIKIEGYSESTLSVTEIIDEISKPKIYSSISFTRVSYIKVIFLESWTPYRYANLQYLLPGSLLEFNGENINTLTLNESTDIISTKLEIDTAHLEVFKQKNEFNILDYNNIIKNLNKNDSADIEVEIEEEGITNNVYLGRYYINKISTNSEELLSIDFVSLLGMMDNVEYIYSGIAIDDQEPLENINVKRIIDSIFSVFLDGIGVPSSEYSKYYELEDGFDQLRTYGYIPKMSCREALQNVCFVNGLRVLDNRSQKISIKKTYIDPRTEPEEKQIITKGKLITNPDVEIQDKIKSLSIKYNEISLNSQEETLMSVKSDGTYIFNSPVLVTRVEVTTPGVTVRYYHNVNFVKIEHISGSSVYNANVIGKRYKLENKEIIHNTSYNEGTSVILSKSGLITEYNCNDFIRFIQEYYELNSLKLKFEYICTTQETGELTKAIFMNNEFTGFLVHQDLDVAGGMVARCELIGYDWSGFF